MKEEKQTFLVSDVARTVSSILTLLLDKTVRCRRFEGEFELLARKWTYHAYRIDHPVGKPTIRVDVREKE